MKHLGVDHYGGRIQAHRYGLLKQSVDRLQRGGLGL